jgi:hypothetical protein
MLFRADDKDNQRVSLRRVTEIPNFVGTSADNH